jgi:ATP/maltotriose-dependent transcriptional regulator MalT/two-component SAPR family response regulator
LPVIVTKIRVPRRQPGLLSRRRLVDFIHTHLDHKLILISAPAGYGKTSLLTDFVQDTDLPVCWYTLDPFDRDLRVFLEHLIAAIALRFTAFGERSRTLLRGMADPGQDLYPFVATLVQEMYDTITEYFVLVLDDYHAVEDQERITEFLDLFATYVDENCHLILASRTLLALPNLSLLLARRQATGLSIDELRFTPKEIQALAQQNYRQTLALEQAEQLAEQTEGWITGLLLTAATHWEQAKVAVRGHINVGLYDYLSRQVLSQQPAPLRDFLLASSVLDELNPELCTAALGVEHPAALMDQLRARNLFVVEFEGGGDRLRYHDLFLEFLRASLLRQDETRFQDLMRRAAEAYAARGEWERAVSRYLTLKDYSRVAEIIEETGTRMLEIGRWDMLASWVDALPEAALISKPHCFVHRGKIHTERGEHAQALTLFDRARQACIAAGDHAWAAYALAQKSSVLRFQGRYAEALTSCQQVLGMVGGASPQEKTAMALAYKDAGLCQLRLGHSVEGTESLQHALRLYQELNAPYNIGAIHHDLGLAHELGGNLKRASDHYQAALQQWQQLGNLAAWANTLNSLGVIHYLQGDYEQASQLLNEALDKVRQANNLRVEALIWSSLGDLQRDLGAYDLARQAYSDGWHAATRAGEGFVVTYALDGLGNTLRLQGDLVHARERISEALEHAEEHGSAYEIGLCQTSLGILEAEKGNLEVARRYLDMATECFEAGGFRREWARAGFHMARVDYARGERDTALSDLKHTLELAEQLGFDQFLVVDGQAAQSLLHYAAGQWAGERNDVVCRLLERIQAHQARLARRSEPAIKSEFRLPLLKVYGLGKPLVELEGHTVEWRTTQSRDLFFYLLQHPGGLTREEIGVVFWPDHSPERLDGIFRSTLYRVRRALFKDSVIFEAGLYRFSRQGDYWFDVEVFEKLLGEARGLADTEKIARLQEACALYRGDYLSETGADWCMLDRERLREQYLQALETLAVLHTDLEALHAAIEFYQDVLAHDQYRESAHRGLMLCYYRLGDRTSAVHQYQACAEILRKELGLSPSPETGKLFLKIIG